MITVAVDRSKRLPTGRTISIECLGKVVANGSSRSHRTDIMLVRIETCDPFPMAPAVNSLGDKWKVVYLGI